MNRRLWAALVAVLMVLSVAACGAKDNSGLLATAAQDDTTSTATADEDPPPDDGTAGVEDSDGELYSPPLVDDDGTAIYGDTTSDPRSPASYEAAKEQGPFVTWADAHRVLGELDWYVEAVNARKSKTGFDWADVEKWATTEGIDPRVIQVFNLEISDQEARDAVRELVGDAADRLPIARHATCIMNTRGFGREVVQNFADCRKMVRVSLAPLVYNEQGDVVGLRSDAGIFVDCFNIWWIPRQVVKNGPPPTPTTPRVPSTPPGTVPPGTVPPGTVPPSVTTTTRPSTTTTTTRPSTTTTTQPDENKDHTQSPISDNPDDPNEPTRPNTPEPDRPPATSPTTTQPRVSPPTTVAPPAPSPPTTAPAPPPIVGCQDSDGVGLCEV